MVRKAFNDLLISPILCLLDLFDWFQTSNRRHHPLHLLALFLFVDLWLERALLDRFLSILFSNGLMVLDPGRLMLCRSPQHALRQLLDRLSLTQLGFGQFKFAASL